MGVPRTVRYFLAALVVAAPFSVVVASGAQAQDVTCQGKPVTSGSIVFMPADRNLACWGGGRIQPDGTFVVDMVAP